MLQRNTLGLLLIPHLCIVDPHLVQSSPQLPPDSSYCVTSASCMQGAFLPVISEANEQTLSNQRS